jgi:hypothetical protein
MKKLASVITAWMAVAMAIAIAIAIVACNPLGHCSPGYDDQWHDVRSCEGNVLVSYSEVCSERSNESRTDCAAHEQVCAASALTLGAACVTACTGDDSCTPDAYCSTTPTSADGHRTCQARLGEGTDCTGAPTACKPGLVCAPRPLWTAPADSQDAGESADAGVPDAGAHRLSASKYCQEDCSKVDPASQTCPFGAPSVCDGGRVRACRCGAPDAVTKTCDPGNVCVVGKQTGEALCAASLEPEPRCGSASGAGYCDGSTFVSCQQGYVVMRQVCPVQTSCTSIGCYGGQ